MTDPFADAKSWQTRAHAHIEEFRHRTGLMGDVWSIRHEMRADGTHVYLQCFDYEAFQMMKVVVAEAANALFQSLDHIVAVPARVAGIERKVQIGWPWKVEADSQSPGAMRPNIGDNIKIMKKAGLPDSWCKFICDVTAAFAADLPRIDALKRISLDGKHWALRQVGPNLEHIVINMANPRRHVSVDIPDRFFEGSGSFVIWRGEMLDPETCEISSLLNFSLGFDDSVDIITAFNAFEAASRFVDRALQGATDLLATGTPATQTRSDYAG